VPPVMGIPLSPTLPTEAILFKPPVYQSYGPESENS
jgi:hypothetical protein